MQEYNFKNERKEKEDNSFLAYLSSFSKATTVIYTVTISILLLKLQRR